MFETVSSRCPPSLIGTFRCRLVHEASCDRHSEDGLAGASTYQYHFAAMFCGYAMGQGKPETGPFLLTLAYEWLKEASGNILGNARAVIFDIKGYQSVRYFKLHFNSTRTGRRVRRLTGIQQQIVDCTLHLLTINYCCGINWIAVLGYECDSCRVRMSTDQGDCSFQQRRCQFMCMPDC